MTYKQLRTEFNRPLFKRRLIEVLGSDCASCGSNANIEYHHVVPLALGGTNRITNIAPLCYLCHQKVHGSENIRKIFRSPNTGRNKKLPVDGHQSIICDYLHGNIGRKECESRLELSKGNKLTDKWYFKEYLVEHDIKSYKNKIDLLSQQRCMGIDYSEKEVARIEFFDGITYIRLGNGNQKTIKNFKKVKKEELRMDTETMIRELQNLQEKHKDDRVFTFETR